MSTSDLPDEIVQPLLRLGSALQEHAWAHRDHSLADHEEGALAALRTAAPVLLEAVLQLATSGLETNARPIAARCPRCRRRRGVQSRRTRQVHTRLGPIRLKRWWHHCWACGHGWSSPDLALGLAPYQQTSAGLARWDATLGAVTTFREAAKLLADLAGVHVGSETLRTQAERVGTELEGQQRRTMAYVEQTHEPPIDEHDPAPGMLVVETDGVMVRYRDRHLDGAVVEGDWHEVKVGLVGGWQHAHLRQPSYVAAREAAPVFARRLGTEAARRGALDVVKWHPWDGTPAELRPVVVLGDGAKWIWEHVATLFGIERLEIVDWYHASEHIWTVAKDLHGEDTPETKVWARTALDHLWQSGPKSMLEWFDATQPGTSAGAAVLKRERSYFSSNAARMQYPSLRDQHLPIGSGAVEAEASAKHLVSTPHETRWLALVRSRRPRHPRSPLPPPQRTFTQLRRLTSYKPRSHPALAFGAFDRRPPLPSLESTRAPDGGPVGWIFGMPACQTSVGQCGMRASFGSTRPGMSGGAFTGMTRSRYSHRNVCGAEPAACVTFRTWLHNADKHHPTSNVRSDRRWPL